MFACVECTQWSMVVLAIVSDNDVPMIWNWNELFRARNKLEQQNCIVYVILIIRSVGFCVQKFWQKMAQIKKKLTYVKFFFTCAIYDTNCKVIKNYSLHVSYDTYTIFKVSNAFPLRKQFLLYIVFIMFSFPDHQAQTTTICNKRKLSMHRTTKRYSWNVEWHCQFCFIMTVGYFAKIEQLLCHLYVLTTIIIIDVWFLACNCLFCTNT